MKQRPQIDQTVKYQLYINGQIKYSVCATNPDKQKEKEIINLVKESFKEKINRANYYTIYKTVKSRIE